MVEISINGAGSESLDLAQQTQEKKKIQLAGEREVAWSDYQAKVEQDLQQEADKNREIEKTTQDNIERERGSCIDDVV